MKSVLEMLQTQYDSWDGVLILLFRATCLGLGKDHV